MAALHTHRSVRLLAKIFVASSAFAAIGPSTAVAGTLQVGPGKTYANLTDANAAAADGDVIEIDAGTYRDVITVTRNNLTIRGVGGHAILDATGVSISNGKAIIVSAGNDDTYENLDFIGATVPDQNGAGVRWEGGGTMTIRHCLFKDNENGILGAPAGGNAVVEFNEFVGNGRTNYGFTHNEYFAEGESVIFRGNWTHSLTADGPDIGHLFKSRAHKTFVLYNRITAEDTHSSYEVNMPQGGEVYIIGNLIQQKVGGQRIIISADDGGQDGAEHPGSQVFVINNTIVNDSAGDATFARTLSSTVPFTMINNLIVGPGTVQSGGVPTLMNNVQTMSPGLVNQTMYDYHLMTGSPAINAGVDPGTGAQMSLVPQFQYVHPMGIEPRGANGMIDVGAYEFGNMPTTDGPPGSGADGGPGDSMTEPGGCCSTSRGDAAGSVLLSAGLGAIVMRRRRRSTQG